jgi:carboxypeptidase T
MNLILRVTTASPRAPLSQLMRLSMGLDIWELKPDYAVVRAADAQAERLRQMGYDVEQLHQTENYVATFATADAATGYHSVETLEPDLRRLAAQEPDIAALVEVGRSLENRPIWALRLGERKQSDRKLLFMGCHHAREWVAVEVPYQLAAYLVSQAGQNPVKQWLSQGEIWVAPMVNPDGHEYTRTQDRLWRKNRRPNPDGSFGVDPNRNYGYMWGILNVNTSSHVPADETYVGPHAFSEPETRAMRDLIAQQRFRGLITYHSFSQLILYPWGYKPDPVELPEDRQRLMKLADRMQKLIRGVHGVAYTAEQASELYPTAGDTTDWAYGEYEIPALTIELRPKTQAEGGFILPANQIKPTWEENQPAALEFIRQLL